ncbi:MAG: hypothetical protein NZ480_00010, partial [Bdellovibrionaceae bacterium]|nr:hypothetical protein [Pseudobdellovibrionaceae bacterium]
MQDRWDGDEVIVLYWGKQWLSEGKFLLLTDQNLPTWETPAAYLFGFIDSFSISPRWLAFFFSGLELLCFYWLARSLFDGLWARRAFLILLSMPYHFFMTTALGPMNTGWLWVFYLFVEVRGWVFWRSFTLLSGMLYYAVFRVVTFWKIIFVERFRFRKIWPELASLVLLGVLLTTFGSWSQFLHKGSYFWERGIYYWVTQYVQSVLIWFVPFWGEIPFFSIRHFNDLGLAFLQLNKDTPLSFVWSVVFAWQLRGLFNRPQIKKYFWLLLFGIFLMGWSATLTHFVAFSCIFALLVTASLQAIPKAKVIFYLGLSWALLSNGFIIYRLYLDKSPVLSRFASLPIQKAMSDAKGDSEKIYVLTQSQVFYVRYLAQKFQFQWRYLPADFSQAPLIDYQYFLRLGIKYLVLLAPVDFENPNPELRKHYDLEQSSFQKYTFHIDYSFN